MQYERDQFDEALLDDNYSEEVDNTDPGFQRMSEMEEEPSETETDSLPAAEQSSDSTQQTEEDTSTEELDALGQFLKSKGVRDGKTIVYEDEETGETNEVEFSSLSTEEQLQILSDLSTPSLSEDEINTINYLRQNNASLQDVITYFQEQAVKEYIEKNSTEPTHEVDSYTDDVLYLAELKRRYPDMSDEELESELETAQANEELFKKKVTAIRASYKEAEEKQKQAALEEEQKTIEAYHTEFANHLDQFSYVLMDHTDPKSDKIVVEEQDKQAIYDYIFKKNPDGMSQLAADLNNMDVLIQLAWLRLYGQDAITDTTKYWKNELKKQRKEVAKKETSTSKTTVVQKQKPQKQESSLGSAWDKYL